MSPLKAWKLCHLFSLSKFNYNLVLILCVQLNGNPVFNVNTLNFGFVCLVHNFISANM